MNIYVGNLPYRTTDEDLRQIFSQFGSVSATSIISDKFTGRSRGFGFVEMDNDNDGLTAINATNGQEFQGRALVVNEARPREERPSNGGGNGGGNRREYRPRS